MLVAAVAVLAACSVQPLPPDDMGASTASPAAHADSTQASGGATTTTAPPAPASGATVTATTSSTVVTTQTSLVVAPPTGTTPRDASVTVSYSGPVPGKPKMHLRDDGWTTNSPDATNAMDVAAQFVSEYEHVTGIDSMGDNNGLRSGQWATQRLRDEMRTTFTWPNSIGLSFQGERRVLITQVSDPYKIANAGNIVTVRVEFDQTESEPGQRDIKLKGLASNCALTKQADGTWLVDQVLPSEN